MAILKRTIIRLIRELYLGNIIYNLKRDKESFSSKSKLSVVDAINILKKYPIPDVQVEINRTEINLDYDLSIIIPVYNAEMKIRKCLNSVCQKSKYKCQIIIVNDGSKDNSEKKIESYLAEQNITYIKTENMGAAAARNVGLNLAEGKYIMFVDADDELSKNAIDNLMDRAYQNNADIVEGGICRKWGIIKLYKKHKNDSNANPLKDLQGYPFAKVIKTSLFSNIEFPQGVAFEDSILSYLVYPQAKRVETIKKITYCYNLNLKGADRTNSKNIKCLHTFYIMRDMLYFQEKYCIEKKEEIYEVFLQQLITNFLRLQRIDDVVQESVFILSVDLMQIYFSNYHVKDKKKQELENILKNKEYKKYKLYCELVK